MDIEKSRCDKYLIYKTLGKGASSKVKLARDSRNGEYVALKIFKSEELSRIKLETEVLQSLKDHPNIIRLIEYIESGLYISKHNSVPHTVSFLVLELATRGDIYELISKLGKLPEHIARYYFKNLLVAISAMHNLGYAHRDIKPENILLLDNFTIKLGDLGFCGVLTGKDGSKLMHTFKGTRAYMAPEVSERKPYDGIKVDLFSCSIIGFILVTGKPPFMRAERMNTHYQHIANKNWSQFWKLHEVGVRLNTNFKDLIESMMSYYPEERLSIIDILQHPWLNEPTASLFDVQDWILKNERFPRSILTDYRNLNLTLNLTSDLQTSLKLSETIESFRNDDIEVKSDLLICTDSTTDLQSAINLN